jgi:hypothetical protein
MTASSRKFDEEMKSDHYILSSSAVKRQKTADPKPDAGQPAQLALGDATKTEPIIALEAVDTTTLNASEFIGVWVISPHLNAFIDSKGVMGLSASAETEITPMSIVFGKFGKGPFEWGDKLKDLSGTVPYTLDFASKCREVKKKGPLGPVMSVSELHKCISKDWPHTLVDHRHQFVYQRSMISFFQFVSQLPICLFFQLLVCF